MKTALEQNREDQALGAAWRRCEAALPEDAHWGFERDPGFSNLPYIAWVDDPYMERSRPDPTEALTALAEALEARGLQEELMTPDGVAYSEWEADQ